MTMTLVFRRLRLQWLRFPRHRRGNVAILFSVGTLPVLGLIGLGVDYSVLSTTRVRLNAAADAAALAAVSRSLNPTIAPPDQNTIAAVFNASLNNLQGVTVNSVSVTSSYTNQGLQVTVAYAAQVSSTFGRMFNVQTLNLRGSATSVMPMPRFANFYLLLDNSPSMGIGATTNDISRLQTLTGGCAFACHQRTSNSQGRVTGDLLTDNYHVAKNNNVQTRIDVVRLATQNLTTTAQNMQQVSQQYGMAVYTFSDTFQTIAPLSYNLATVQTQANAIDLAYSYVNQRDTQTSFETALSYMNGIIPNPGDGSSTNSPAEYLFIVTDGAVDQPVGSGSGSGDTPDRWSNGSLAVPSNNQPNLVSTLTGNVNGTRYIAAIDPTLCDALKNRGVKIAVLYTTYLPITANAFYNQWIAPISTQIGTNLQACASPGLFFPVSPTQGINDAMQIMFQKAVAYSRLMK